MLYADFECLLKAVDEQYREKMNQTKNVRRGKTPYREKINTHVHCGWCVLSTFAYADIFDPLKMYLSKDCVQKRAQQIKTDVKSLYSTFPQ